MRLFPGVRPSNLGVRGGALAAPPRSPNAVSSQADAVKDAGHHIAPFGANGDADGTWRRLVALVRALPSVEIVTTTDRYVHAECSTTLLGFVDDLELLLDRAAAVIHVRSASRLGRRDFGVNRARVETLRAQLDSGC